MFGPGRKRSRLLCFWSLSIYSAFYVQIICMSWNILFFKSEAVLDGITTWLSFSFVRKFFIYENILNYRFNFFNGYRIIFVFISSCVSFISYIFLPIFSYCYLLVSPHLFYPPLPSTPLSSPAKSLSFWLVFKRTKLWLYQSFLIYNSISLISVTFLLFPSSFILIFSNYLYCIFSSLTFSFSFLYKNEMLYNFS